VTDSYSLVVKKSAARELCALPKADLLRVTDRIRGLANTPRFSGHEKLSGQVQYHVRQGDYRVVYAIDDDHRIVTIVKIGHRREVYR